MFIQSLFNRFSQTGRARFHRDLGAIAIGLLVACFALGTQAAETDVATSSDDTQRVATSTGVASDPKSVTGKTAPLVNAETTKPRTDAGSPKSSTAAKSSLYGDFEIFDADVTLYFDDDFDGHYYGIDVNFDADTDYAAADVYARLYLSLEGGPWEIYYTTEIFTLFGDSASDDFTVETELYSGYPTAYYDVLIELYDADTDDLVAEFGPGDSAELFEAPLEDQLKDVGIVTVGPEPIVSHSHGGGGSLSVIWLALLTLVLSIRNRALNRSQVALPETSRSIG